MSYKVLHTDARNWNLRIKFGHHKIQRTQTNNRGQAILGATEGFLDKQLVNEKFANLSWILIFNALKQRMVTSSSQPLSFSTVSSTVWADKTLTLPNHTQFTVTVSFFFKGTTLGACYMGIAMGPDPRTHIKSMARLCLSVSTVLKWEVETEAGRSSELTGQPV